MPELARENVWLDRSKQAAITGNLVRRYEKFESTIYDVQQKSGFKNILLERKLQAINESLEKKESQLSEVIHAANLDPNLLGTVSKKLDDVLDAKNGAIKDLQYEVARYLACCALSGSVVSHVWLDLCELRSLHASPRRTTT
jgi:hypothetical protein